MILWLSVQSLVWVVWPSCAYVSGVRFFHSRCCALTCTPPYECQEAIDMKAKHLNRHHAAC